MRIVLSFQALDHGLAKAVIEGPGTCTHDLRE